MIIFQKKDHLQKEYKFFPRSCVISTPKDFFLCQYLSTKVLKYNFKPSSHGANNHNVWPRKAGKKGNFPAEKEGKFLGEEWNKSISSGMEAPSKGSQRYREKEWEY